MVGGTLTALFGGVFHWWPKIWGRMYNDAMGRVGCFLVFSGFCLTFFPQFVMGARGMPRRYASYDPEFVIFHQMSTVGAFVPDFHNFIHKPVFNDPYDFSTQVYDEELDTYIHRDFAEPKKDPAKTPQPDMDPVKRSKES
jgi:cytochrome c oxidase subunit 1